MTFTRARSRRGQFVHQALVLAALLVVSCDANEVVEPSVQGSLAPDFTAVTATATSRNEFNRPNWMDADHDCQTTRIEVLAAEATGPVEFEGEHHCKILRGHWRCPYTGELIEDPRDLDIDHVVPLKNAWDSGASVWSDERWHQFANDLERSEHLVAVSAKANRAKGAKAPDQWLPPLPDSRCSYVRDWTAIKVRWELGASEAEKGAIERWLALCDGGQIPPLPQDHVPEPTPVDSGEACCKVCRKGKACGDTCIARDKTCSVPPGCACDE